MKNIHQLRVAGALVAPFGVGLVNLHQPSPIKMIGTWLLSNVAGSRAAIIALKKAVPTISLNSRSQLASTIRRLTELVEAQAEPIEMSIWMAEYSVLAFGSAMETLKRVGIREWSRHLIPSQTRSGAFAANGY